MVEARLRWYGSSLTRLRAMQSQVRQEASRTTTPDYYLKDSERKRLETVRDMLSDGRNPFEQVKPLSLGTKEKPERVEKGPTPEQLKDLTDKWTDRRILRPRKVIIVEPAQPIVPRCLACRVEVNPGFTYTGKVLRGWSRIPIEKKDGEEIRITVSTYERGYVCSDCASITTVAVNERTGERLPVIVAHPPARPQPPEEKTPKPMFRHQRTMPHADSQGKASEAWHAIHRT